MTENEMSMEEQQSLLEKQLKYIADSIEFFKKEIEAHELLKSVYEKVGVEKIDCDYVHQLEKEYWEAQKILLVVRQEREINTLESELENAFNVQSKIIDKLEALKGD